VRAAFQTSTCDGVSCYCRECADWWHERLAAPAGRDCARKFVNVLRVSQVGLLHAVPSPIEENTPSEIAI
jgi:hypothetical protein